MKKVFGGLVKILMIVVGTVNMVALVIVLFNVVVITLKGPFSYSFRQDRSNIEKVEICAYDHEKGIRQPLVELSDEEADALMSEISALDCKEDFSLVDWYGDVIISITYLDGEIEIIGTENIGWISPNGQLYTTSYYFETLEMRALIAKYVDPDILEEVSNEF